VTREFPCWQKRRLPPVHVLKTPAEAAAAQVQARLDRLREFGYVEPTYEERKRNQFVNVDLLLHLPRER